MEINRQHVLAFSPNSKLFAFINNQGILRIWDTETNNLVQEYTPNLHLAEPCTAITWIALSTETDQKNHRKSLPIKGDTLYIALGTAKGHISLYSYALGKVERNLKGEGHSGEVKSMYYDNVTGMLYTSGEDCQIIVWNIAKEKQISSWSVGVDVPYSISYMPASNKLVVGSRQIKVYSVETQELCQTFIGHTSEINLMKNCTIGNAEYVATASKMDRIICLWKIGKHGTNKPAACTLLMEDIAHCLSCQTDFEGENLQVVSVTRSGVIHIYLISLESMKSAKKPIKPKISIEIASDSTTTIKPIPAIAASIYQNSKETEILFGYGNNYFMTFERLVPNYAEKLQVLVRTDPKTLKSSKSTEKDKDKDKALKTVHPLINENDVDYKPSYAALSKKVKVVDTPMETRLQNLNLNATKIVAQPQSKAQLLVQALHSKDVNLMRTVIRTNDPKTIQLTLQNLPVQYVGELINELTSLMQKKRVDVEFALKWLKGVVQIHSSQLMALGHEELMNKLGPCVGLIEYRANILQEISKLNGRLNLLVSQIKRSKESEEFNNENLLVYEDNDSSNSDIEQEKGEKISSDDEWDEDENEEQNSVEEMET